MTFNLSTSAVAWICNQCEILWDYLTNYLACWLKMLWDVTLLHSIYSRVCECCNIMLHCICFQKWKYEHKPGNDFQWAASSAWCVQLLFGKSEIPRTLARHLQISWWTHSRHSPILQRVVWFWKLVNHVYMITTCTV